MRQRNRQYRGKRAYSNNDFPVILSILFFSAAILYHETLLRLFDIQYTPFFGMGLLRTLLFSLAAGCLAALLLDLIPQKTVSRILGGVLLLANTVLVCIERGCRAMFGVYFGPTTIAGMAGDVVGGFGGTVGGVILGILPFILLSLVPLVLYVVFRGGFLQSQGLSGELRVMLVTMILASQLVGYLLSTVPDPEVTALYTYNFSANSAVPSFGALTAMRLDLEYAVVGTPEQESGSFLEEPSYTNPPATVAPGGSSSGSTPAPVSTSNPENPDASADPEVTDPPATEPPAPIEYGYNVLDLDFEALANGAKKDTLKEMHQYFGSLTPTQKTKYSGMFEGKNLIFITAEGFSPYVISEELTPTLYRLTHEGFVFTNYYQPDWTMSTVGGEFANCTGVIPNWINGGWTVNAVIKGNNAEPFTLGNLFAAQGYSVPAWHNHLYSYYNRDKYLTLFGYDYKGARGGGLTIPSENLWPESDLDLMEATADSYIQDYLDNGQLFHAYYMTVSGHCLYTFSGNAMSARNREAAQAAYPDASPVVQAYIACHLELEKAMAYLVNRLEEAGIADDTLIVMGADHYPYWLANHPELAGDNNDYYNELRGVEDTELVTSRYRNALIMWSGAIEEPIVVDTPCYSCDIVPTICNLFGIPYDSRLYIGRDILADNWQADQYSSSMPLVVFANNHGQGNSWITAAGTYEASTKKFTPNEGITVADDYVSRVNRLVAGKINYSKLIVTQDYYSTLPLDSLTGTDAGGQE